MSRGPLIALGGGLLGALLFLSVRTGSPVAVLFAFLSPAPLYAVGLSQGLPSALIASAAALAAVAVTASGSTILTFFLCVVAPMLIVVRQGLLSRPAAQPGAMEWYPPGLLLSWLTGYGLAVLAGAIAWHLGHPGGLEGVIRDNLNAAFGNLTGGSADPRSRGLFAMLPRWLPGTIILMWLLTGCLSAMLAQAGLVRAGHARRPTPAYMALDLPRWTGFALAAAILLMLLPAPAGTMGRNGLVILSLPFFLLGLATVHSLSRRLAGRGLFLALVYALVSLLVWPALFVVILGIIEQWFLLRRRFASPGTGREDV